MRIVDAHQDLATNALVMGRDLRRSALETRRLEAHSDIPAREGQCMLGLPELLAGGVALVCGTIFVPPPGRGSPDSYTDGEIEDAYRSGQAQLDFYHSLSQDSDQLTLVQDNAGIEAILASWNTAKPKVGIVLLMEGADPIREPKEIEAWFERGVRMVGLAWRAGSRYAGGDSAPGPLTDAGRDLLPIMAELGLILDLSHLAEEAYLEAVDRFEGQLVATHANPRVRVPGPRQLSDRMIHLLAERDGVMGIVPYNRFLKPGWDRGDAKDEVTVADVAAAIDHVCQVVGDAAHVGVGSDFDGGFGAESAPAGIDTVADLPKIAAALGEMGYGDADIAAAMGDNWLRVLRAGLPG